MKVEVMTWTYHEDDCSPFDKITLETFLDDPFRRMDTAEHK